MFEENESEELPTLGLTRRMSATSLTLTPAFHAQMRRLKPTYAIFNLVSTIMGGGVLSLPYALQKTGVVLGVFLIVLCAAISDFSVYILVAAARKAGAESYEDLALRVGGKRAKYMVIGLVFTLTWLCCVAYIVLAGELIMESLAAFIHIDTLDSSTKLYAMSGGTFLVLPLCFLDELHALRYTSVVSIVSVVVLTLAIIVRSVQSGQGFADPNRIKWFPDSLGDVVYSLPFYCVAYLCHFNVLPMHCELRRPTRQRMKKVIHFTMGIPACLYVLAGLFGYLYSLEDTCDSILKNFGARDPFITAGRLGLTFTILFSFPLLVLPCRDSFNRLLVGVWALKRSRGGSDLQEPLVTASQLDPNSAETCEEPAAAGIDGEAYLKAKLLGSRVYRVCCTLGLVGTALYVAYAVPGISVIWSLMGSTVSLCIAFILPTWFYLAMKNDSICANRNKFLAGLLLVVSIVAAVVCTIEAFVHVHDVTCHVHTDIINNSTDHNGTLYW